MHDPPVVLADEPTAHLDHIQVEGVLQLLRELASPGRVVIVSTHDDRVTHLADRVVELVPNLAGADRPPEELQLRGRASSSSSRAAAATSCTWWMTGEVEIYRERGDGTEEPLATVVAGVLLRRAGPHAEPAAERLGPRRAPPPRSPATRPATSAAGFPDEAASKDA